jgi:proteasome lid subunit RPN8/RPN11
MDVLWLTPQQAREIGSAALQGAPHEVCGVIGGRGAQALRIIPTPNVAPDPTQYYEIDPRALVDAMMTLRSEKLDVIGFYHSHPHSAPVPSRTDVALAAYPDTAMLIVGLRNGAPELAAWRVRHGNAERMTLHVADVPPPADSGRLSQAQVTAIILSAVLAVAAFLGISISLLPPAPPIP